MKRLAQCALAATFLWTIGSLLGLALQRVGGGEEYWSDVAKDCSVRETVFGGKARCSKRADEALQFTLWTAIYVVGLGLDLVVAVCGLRLIAPLELALSKKIQTAFVFSAGLL